jgi:c(7)-type cytochrome triheme protein
MEIDEVEMPRLCKAFLFVLCLGLLIILNPSQTFSQQPPKGTDEKKADGSKDKLERMKEKLKKVDPSLAIYLDKNGNIAGTGDPTVAIGELDRLKQREHPPALQLAELPLDQFGLVNWVEALKQGKIKPRDAVDPNAQITPPFDLDILIKTKSKYQPDVIFSHKVHTNWLSCNSCHNEIFKQKAGGNPEMHMKKIAAGEYCGRCHNRVAFPLFDCLRCHVKPKEGSTEAVAPAP